MSELGDRGRPAGEPKKAVERMKWEETLEERMEERGAEREKTAGRLRFLINLVYFGVLIVLTALAVRYLLLWMMPFVFAFLTAAAAAEMAGENHPGEQKGLFGHAGGFAGAAAGGGGGLRRLPAGDRRGGISIGRGQHPID